MHVRTLIVVVLCVGLWMAAPSGQAPAPPDPGVVEGEILVRFRPQATQARRDSVLAASGGRRIRRFEAINLDHVRLPRGRRVDDAIAAMRAGGDVVSAQPNYIRRIAFPTPPNDYYWINDVFFGFYGMKKIQADQAWSTYTTGSSAVVVAVIDTGVKYDHPDLAANMWTNPGEIAGNGIDEDANGYVDDVYGIDTFNHDSNPRDDNGHGTHTAGTIGAKGNNALGVVGVNWTVRILACKFLSASGSGTDAGAIECFNYITALRNRGINIRASNNSWGEQRDLLDPFPQVMKDAIDAAGNAGILNVFAAGNGGTDQVGDNIDTSPFDPASFTSPSIVSVAASDSADNRATFSNYGVTSVDLAAPGVRILSTWIGNNYAYLNGTSMATPHVAGAAALLAAQSPALPVAGLKSLLLGNADPVGAWAGLVASGGRLNVFKAANAVAANTAPSVHITSPLAGDTFTAPASLNVSAYASDTTGTVVTVEFYANGALLGSDSASPFSLISLGAPAGNYTLTAKATDNLGAVTMSAPVLVTVFPAAMPSASLTSSSLTFAKQRVGTTSVDSQAVSISNSGPGSLVFSSFNGALPTSAFTVGAGDFQGQTDCPLTVAGLPAATSCTFTFHFSPIAAGTRAATLSIVTNATTSPHAIALNGTAFVVDAPTVAQTVASSGGRLTSLQQKSDGGWYFGVNETSCGLGLGVSCGNILGVTALGLLSAYERDPIPATLAAAVATGDRLLAAYAGAPAVQPFSQDLEFLNALTQATSDPAYAATAALWFQTVTAAHPNAADRVDWSFARRDAQGRRSLAVWDLASLIRSAKAAGQVDYALAAATRIRDLEAGWRDLNPAYTLLGMGSMLWAIHDLPGFDAQITDYRSFLLAQQDATGAWGAGNLQITAYVVLGLANVGGPGTDAAIGSAVAFFIANQLPLNGWPFVVVGGAIGGEYATVDAEVLRAVATLYSTQAGSSVLVTPAQLSTVTFSTVAAPGATTVVALDNVGGMPVPFGFSLVSGLSYEVRTSAAVNGGITLCLAVPWAATTDAFATLRILHAEQGAFVDRTIQAGPLAPDAAARRLCAQVSALNAFAVAVRDPNAVDTTAPEMNVTLSPSVLTHATNRLVTITATIGVSDNADPAPVVTLVSITSNDGRHGRVSRRDVQDADMGTDDRSFKLRAERSDHGRDRIYTIVYRATDQAGNAKLVSASVVVPRRRR